MLIPALNLYLSKCNPNDPKQLWKGPTFLTNSSSSVVNVGSSLCLSTLDQITLAPCDGTDSQLWFYNHTNSTLFNLEHSVCVDAHGGKGPAVDIYECHPEDFFDHFNQQFFFDEFSGLLRTGEGVGECNSQCVTVSSPDDSDVSPKQGEQSCSSTGALTLLPQDDGELSSAALDGSQYGLYFVPSVKGSSKWTIYFEGGGWCFNEQQCLERSITATGSSKLLATARDCQCYNAQGDGLEQDCNCLYLPYLDGASFSGYKREKTSVVNETSNETQDLYFRGIKNLDHALRWALQKGLDEATQVAVAGGSAGGLSTYLHADRVREYVWKEANLKEQIFVYAAPDVGYFLDHEAAGTNEKPFTEDFFSLFKMVNASFGEDGGLMGKCEKGLEERGMDARLCFFAEHVVEFIETPIFAFNSKFDSFQLAYVLEAYNFTDNKDRIEDTLYGKDFVAQLEPLLNDKKNGCFITTCICHGCPWPALRLSDVPAYEHFANWVDYVVLGRGEKTHFHIDNRIIPNGGLNPPVTDGFQKCEVFA
ncbi:hypothetical protein ScalyP_jg7825 [Parmales sp. scaly parma]|nr:hypothetical protein ScalyP_jg7825 [Parmales sp. scaly parma]